MAGYGYTNRGGGNTNDWNRSYYGENGGYPDEVRRPVIGDEVRKRPIISYTAPNLNNSSASESYAAATRLEPVKDYGVTTNRWRGPSSSTNYDNPLLQNVEESADSTSRLSTRPTGYLSSTNWRNPSGTGATTGYGYGYGNGYGGEYTYANTNTNLNNSSNWNVRPNAYGNSIDGWESRSGRKGWAATSSDQGQDTLLSGPTNDIGKAVEILKDAAAKSSRVASAVPQVPRFAFPAASTTGGGPTRDTYTYATDTNIDESARRYGNFNLWSSRRSQQF